MASIFNEFDRIRIINLAHRSDRRKQMDRQLRSLGVSESAHIEYFKAFKCETAGKFESVGAHGAYRSHTEILKQAAEANESVLILEDDCEFYSRIRNYLMPECDIFYGGYEASDPEDLKNSDIIGAHFMGFSAAGAKAAADYFSEYLDDSFVPVT